MHRLAAMRIHLGGDMARNDVETMEGEISAALPSRDEELGATEFQKSMIIEKARKRRRRSIRATVAATGAAISLAIVVVSLSLSGGEISPKTHRPTAGAIPLYASVGGRDELLTSSSRGLVVVSPQMGTVIRQVSVRVPAAFRGPGVTISGLGARALTAVPGDATAFGAYVVLSPGKGRDFVVAISLRSGREEIIAEGGNPALSPNGKYLAWQRATAGQYSQLTGVVIVENLWTGQRQQMSAFRSARMSSATASSLRLAWSQSSKSLAISYSANGDGRQHILVFTAGRAVSSANPSSLPLAHAAVGESIDAMTWIGRHTLVAGGNDICRSPSGPQVCRGSKQPLGIVRGPALAVLDTRTGESRAMVAGHLYAVRVIAGRGSRASTVIGGSVAGYGDLVVQRLGHTPFLRGALTTLAWVSSGALVG